MPAGSEGMHSAETYNIDAEVRQCALELEDERLTARLAGGDMIAIEAKYHLRCLVDLYNRHRKVFIKKYEGDNEK